MSVRPIGTIQNVDKMSMDGAKLVHINFEQLVEELKTKPNWEALPPTAQESVLEEIGVEIGRSLVELVSKDLIPKKTKLRRKKVDQTEIA